MKSVVLRLRGISTTRSTQFAHRIFLYKAT
jgi:hypothetical protein